MLKDMVKIDKRFENSINLYLDIDNRNKIDSYVYTRSSQNIMDYYLDNIDNDRNHATMLIGPYGKGKSHMLLVLLDKVRSMEHPYLPIIISGTGDDLNQAFLIGLTDALKRARLEKLAPESYYSEAARRIGQWKCDFPDAYDRFKAELHKLGIGSVDDFTRELGRQSKKALGMFEQIYPVITSGSEFKPFLMVETVRIYEQIRDVLAREYGYSGLYIIFDEFSKYVEGHEKDTFAKDMKVLQDMCELAGRSGDGRIYLTCVAHKSIKEYDAKLSGEMKNAFRGVEARLDEVRFVVSSQNNYELIGNVIRKDNNALKRIRRIERYYQNAIKSYSFSCFSGLFDEDDFRKYVVEGCFPLMPLTAYMLLHISEKVAQNERSIFTYLSHDEKGSLCRIVEECTLDEADYGVTADTIYDYFKSLFRADGTDALIHNEWLKAEYALERAGDEDEKKVIKVIALIGIIDRPDEVSADMEHIACSLNITSEECSAIMDRLVERKAVIYRRRKHAYCFYNNVGVDIQAEIAGRAAKLPADADILGTLKSISELDYVLPKKYNQDFSMTRYFEYVFMTPEQISRLPKPSVLFEQRFSDGKIVAVVSEQPVEYDEQLFERLNDKRIVVLVPQMVFNQTDNIRKYIAARELIKDKAFIDENAVLEQELVNYCDDAAYEVNRYLEEAFDTESGMCRVYHANEKYAGGFRHSMTFNMFLSSIMMDYYDNAPIVNNELINRQNISAQNKKARNKIVDMILSNADCSEFLKGTSPESTIYRAVLVNTGVCGGGNIESGCERVIMEIDRFIAQCDDNRCSFKVLYDRIMGMGYGTRKGIIPIYISLCLSRLHDKPVLSFKEKEVELDSGTLGNVNDAPGNYYLYVEHKSIEKQNYINELKKLFGAGTGQDDDRGVLTGILRWFRALPQAASNIGRDARCDENMAAKLKKLCSMLRRQDYNPHDFLFTELPAGVGADKGDYVSAIDELVRLKQFLDHYLENVSSEAASIIRRRCGADEQDSLRAVLDGYNARYAGQRKDIILNRRTQSIVRYISGLSTFDDAEIVSGLSKLVTDIYIDDWRDGMLENFKRGWNEFCDEIESEHSAGSGTGIEKLLLEGQNQNLLDGSDTDDNSTSYFLKNAIREAIDEFGDSLDTKEKVAVLARVLAELVAGENT